MTGALVVYKPKRKTTSRALVVHRKRQYKRNMSVGFKANPLYNKVSVFPRTITTTLPYCAKVELTTGVTGFPGVYSFRTNSTYDPDFTGGGHQQLFRDQLEVIYAHYRVNFMDYKITCMTGNKTAIAVLFATQDTTYNPANSPLAVTLEKRGCSTLKTWYPGGPILMFKGRIHNHQLMGVSKSKYNNDDKYSAPVGNDPVETGYVTLVTESPQNAYNDLTQWMVELRYNITYYGQQVIPPS